MEFIEVISLAQHYGVPTKVLDWTYDYKVALYFALKDILKDKNNYSDGVLWAFNQCRQVKIFSWFFLLFLLNIHVLFLFFRNWVYSLL